MKTDRYSVNVHRHGHMEIVVDPGNDVPRKFFDCQKGFSIFIGRKF